MSDKLAYTIARKLNLGERRLTVYGMNPFSPILGLAIDLDGKGIFQRDYGREWRGYHVLTPFGEEVRAILKTKDRRWVLGLRPKDSQVWCEADEWRPDKPSEKPTRIRTFAQHLRAAVHAIVRGET